MRWVDRGGAADRCRPEVRPQYAIRRTFILHPRERDVDRSALQPATSTLDELQAKTFGVGKEAEDEMFSPRQTRQAVDHACYYRTYNL